MAVLIMATPPAAQGDRGRGHDENCRSKKRHILILNHVSRVSGGEQGLLDTVESVDRDRYRFTVVIPPGGNLEERVRAAGADVETLRFRRFTRTRNPIRLACYAGTYAVGVLRLVRIMRRLCPDLVHANSNTAHLYGGPAARLAGVPAVWHSRDLVELGALGRRMFRSCRACVAISRAVATHLNTYADEAAKVHMIHNGVDTARFSPRDRSGLIRDELGVAPDAVLVGAVGQLVPWKKHELFLDAAAEVVRQDGDVHFAIIGDDLFGDHPGYREQLEARADTLGLAGKVHFVGYCEDIVPALADLDLVVHTADREPFGRALAEAMAMGRPVVAVNANGPAEIVRDGTDGMLVPADDVGAIAVAVLELVRSPGRRASLGCAARERIVAAFDRDAFGARMAELYDEVTSCA